MSSAGYRCILAMRGIISLYYWFVGLLYFGFLLLVILIRSHFQALPRYNAWLQRHIMRLFKLVGSNVVIERSEPIPMDRPLIFMANHTSLLDIPLLQTSIPGPYIGILARPQFSYFLYGRVVRKMGHIPIDRESVRRSLEAFQKAQEHLAGGGWIVVLPEGGRALDGRLKPFKKLPFRFALESGADIVPIGISGAFAMKPKHTWHLHPRDVNIRFGSIISTKEFAGKDPNILKEKVEASIRDLLEPLEAGVA